MTITLARALAEIKLIDKKVAQALREYKFVDVKQKNANNGLRSSLASEKATATFDSNYKAILDLIARREKLKSALVKANATTSVKIGGKDYTIAEAIERKQSIGHIKGLVLVLTQQKNQADADKKSLETKTEEKIEGLLKVALGANKQTEKGNTDTVKQVGDAIRQGEAVEYIDPLNIAERIGTLNAEVEEFELEVDFALSEANAKTTVEV